VAYDVPDDRRRTRLAKVLENFGDRIQFSVFVVDVSPAKLLRMRAKVSEVIDPDSDSVLFCDLGLLSTLDEKRFSYLGQSRGITAEGAIIL